MAHSAAPMASQAAGRITKSPWHFPGSYWFPVAATYTALTLPWSVLGLLGWLPAPPGLRHGLGHAHEMLFGFALAVVAGYTLTPANGRWPRVLLAAWVLARLSFLAWPASGLAAALNALFVAGLAAAVAPTYLRTRKWRNRSPAVIILALGLAVFAFHAVDLAAMARWRQPLLLAAVLLLSALMFFMGGRILAPAIAGHIRRKAPMLEHVVQARIEGSTLITLAAAIACTLLPSAPSRALAGALLLAGAALALTRMLRWRCWLCWDQPDLLALLAGYAWLIAGWVLVGRALLINTPPTAALHAITVGALGTLTFSVMLRTQMFRATSNTTVWPWAHAGALVMAAAAIGRITAESPGMLVAAAGLWGLAYAGLIVMLLLLKRRQGAKHGRQATDASSRSEAQ